MFKGYVRRWRAEHAAIRKELASLVQIDIGGASGRKRMAAAKALITKHLKDEDEILYPTLKWAARKDVNLARVLEILRKEMDEIAPKVAAFFAAYEDDPASGGRKAEFETIAKLIVARIEREDGVLIADLEKME